jgi:hypothetical protein
LCGVGRLFGIESIVNVSCPNTPGCYTLSPNNSGRYTLSPNSSTSPVSSESSTSQSPPSQKIRVTVPSTQEWYATGIDVTGKSIQIRYVSGSWSNTSDNDSIWDDGKGNQPWSGLLVPQAPFRSLVGKTNSGTFYVGKRYSGNPGSGHLYLAMNDVEGTYDDNAGQLTVEVTVK